MAVVNGANVMGDCVLIPGWGALLALGVVGADRLFRGADAQRLLSWR